MRKEDNIREIQIFENSNQTAYDSLRLIKSYLPKMNTCVNVRVINACSPKENEDTQEDQQNEFTADKQQVKFLKSSKSQVESCERKIIFVKFMTVSG